MLDSVLAMEDGAFAITFDFANAFNEVSRSAIRQELASFFPSLLRYFDLRYRDPSFVHFYSRSFSCSEGVRQGDPWGPVFFSLALQRVLVKLDASMDTSAFLRAYLDDATAVWRFSDRDAFDRCLQFARDLAAAGAEIGLTLRLKKSMIYSRRVDLRKALPADFIDTFSQIPAVDVGAKLRVRAPHVGLPLLGSLVGSPKAVRAFAARKLGSLVEDMKVLSKIHHLPQEAMLLLRHSFNRRPHFLARTLAPHVLVQEAGRFDSAVLGHVGNILPGALSRLGGRPLRPSDREAMQFFLPQRFGGLSLTPLAQLCTPAFLGSFAAAWPHLLSVRADHEWVNFYNGGILYPVARRVVDCLRDLARLTISYTSPSSHFPLDRAHAASGARVRAFLSFCQIEPGTSPSIKLFEDACDVDPRDVVLGFLSGWFGGSSAKTDSFVSVCAI